MAAPIGRFFLVITTLAGLALASNYSTSQLQQNISTGLCEFKNNVTSLLPTLLFFQLFFVAASIFIELIIINEWVHRYNKSNPKANLRITDFLHMPLSMKIVVLAFILLEISLIISLIIGVLLAYLAPELVKSFLGVSTGMNVSATC